MGHSSITVTLDRYGHLFLELDESIATAFDARFRAMAPATQPGRRPARVPAAGRRRLGGRRTKTQHRADDIHGGRPYHHSCE
jgi:hypothetical protein